MGKMFRHPGESYIDYVALLDSIYLRQQRIFEEEMWRHFQRICHNSCCGPVETVGRIATAELQQVFSDPMVMALLMREIPQSSGTEEHVVSQRMQSSIRQHCAERGTQDIEFRSLAALLHKLLCAYSVPPRDLVGIMSTELEALDTVSTVL